MPQLSIVTATNNAQKTLSRLLSSVAQQNYRDVDIVIQDNTSTDGTDNLIQEFRSSVPSLSFVCEPDTGIYDAWNKAIARAQGEWVLFLGADDQLHDPEVLTKAALMLSALPDSVDFLMCSALLTYPDGSAAETWIPSPDPLAGLSSGMPFPHTAVFHRTRLLKNELFVTHLHIAGDYDFFCRTLRSDNYAISPLLVTRMALGGVSSSLASLLKSERECYAVSRQYVPHALPCKLWARMLRSAVCVAAGKLCGDAAARAVADAARALSGKPPLWTRKQGSPVLPPPTQRPKVSLLVATLGRQEPLQHFLESLNGQTWCDFEVLIADQNPAGYLDMALKALDASTPLRHVLLPAEGLSKARNALLPLATGEIIAFPDDDCVYPPDTLERVKRFFSDYAATGAALGIWVEGRVSSAENKTNTPRQLAAATAISGSETYLQFYRRQVVETVGGFDERLGPGTGLPYGCGEDTDYVLRALQAGFEVYRVPSIRVSHPRPALDRPEMAVKWRAYGQGRMELLRKHHFPLWFKLGNVAFPLVRALQEPRRFWNYRWNMFCGRLRGLFQGN